MPRIPYNILYFNDREIGIIRFASDKQADVLIRYWRQVYDNSLRIIPIKYGMRINNIKVLKGLHRYLGM